MKKLWECLWRYRTHQKLRGYILTQKKWISNSHAMEQSQLWSKIVTKVMTAPYCGKDWSNSFKSKYNLSAFDIFYLHKYYHNFGEFPWHHNSISLKIIAHDCGNTSQQQSWLTETPWEFEPLISSLTTINMMPIQLRNSPAFAFLTLFRLIFGIFSLSTMVMSIFWYSNTWIWSILLLCNS